MKNNIDIDKLFSYYINNTKQEKISEEANNEIWESALKAHRESAKKQEKKSYLPFFQRISSLFQFQFKPIYKPAMAFAVVIVISVVSYFVYDTVFNEKAVLPKKEIITKTEEGNIPDKPRIEPEKKDIEVIEKGTKEPEKKKKAEKKILNEEKQILIKAVPEESLANLPLEKEQEGFGFASTQNEKLFFSKEGKQYLSNWQYLSAKPENEEKYRYLVSPLKNRSNFSLLLENSTTLSNDSLKKLKKSEIDSILKYIFKVE